MQVICANCGKEVEKQAGHVNRSLKLGLKFFCNHTCFGISRRKTIEEKKRLKAEYDKNFRYYHKDGIKERKAAEFKKDYAANPEKYKRERQRRYPKHLGYLSKPEYREWKKNYDLKYRTDKNYGEFSEAAMILFEIQKLVDNRLAKSDAGLNNKIKIRRKLCNSLKETS